MRCEFHNFYMNENEIFCPSELANESNVFMEGVFSGVNADPET